MAICPAQWSELAASLSQRNSVNHREETLEAPDRRFRLAKSWYYRDSRLIGPECAALV